MSVISSETTDGKHILIDTGTAPDQRPAAAPPAQNEINVIEHLVTLGIHPRRHHHSRLHSTSMWTTPDIMTPLPKRNSSLRREHYELARSGHPRYAAARTHWEHPLLRYRLIDGDTEILPGLTLIETSGHAPGHQSVLVRLPKSGPVLLAIDAVMMQRLFAPDRKAWPMDDNEERLRASTQRLLDLVERENIPLVIFGHDGHQWRTLKKSPEYYD